MTINSNVIDVHPNFASLLDKAGIKVNDKAVQAALQVLTTLRAAGKEAVLVGGCIRDLLRGKKPHDWDVVTSAFLAMVQASFENTKVVGEAFGVCLVTIGDVQIEVATRRLDGASSNGRHPSEVVLGVSEAEDCSRRDFTCNAIVFDPFSGEMRDYFGGAQHIRDGVLHTVGNAGDRFDDDLLRMLRAAVVVARFGFRSGVDLIAAIKSRADQIMNLPADRLRREFIKILESANPVAGIEFLKESGLLQHIIPELIELDSPQGLQDGCHHPEGSTWTHTMMALKLASTKMRFMDLGNPDIPNWLVLMAVLMHDIGKPATQAIVGMHDDGSQMITNIKHEHVGAEMADRICTRLRFSKDHRHFVVTWVKEHMMMHQGKKLTVTNLKRLLMREDILPLMVIQWADSLGTTAEDRYGKCLWNWYMEKLAEFADELDILRLALHGNGFKGLVDGRMLKELGFKPSPQFAPMLKEAGDAQLENVFNSKESAIAWVVEKFGHLR
jgi:poly(A) polymerase